MAAASLLYADSPTAQLVAPWIDQHLAHASEVTRHHVTQLTTGLMEATDVRVSRIAQGSVFRATTVSNETQVRRILRDPTLTLEDVYGPLITSLLHASATPILYLAMDESSHTDVVGLFQVTLVTDAMALPLHFHLSDPHQPWADAARACLRTLAAWIPPHVSVIMLADRVHAGKEFVQCWESLGWQYIVRLCKDTRINTDTGWRMVKHLHPRRHPTRRWEEVAVWKTQTMQANVVIHRHEREGFRPTVWYVLTNLPADAVRCVEYAARWWQECGFKITKSAVFQWEQSRITDHARITVLLIGVACATWVLWMLGRWREHRPRIKPTTTKAQPRRVRVIRLGIHACADILTRRIALPSLTLPAFRVLDYERAWVPPNQGHVMQ